MILRGESHAIFSEIMCDIFGTDVEKRRRGDHLGIFAYIALWFFGVLIYAFSSSAYIFHAMVFYLFYDLMGVLFIILFLFHEKNEVKKGRLEKTDRFIVFYTKGQTLAMLCFVGILYLLYTVVIVRLIYTYFHHLWFATGGILEDPISLALFQFMRIVPAEEMAFRGLGMFLCLFMLNHLFNKEAYRDITVSKGDKKTTKYERREKWSWLLSIILIGIMFGMFHFFRFYDPDHFPFFFVMIGSDIYKIHIIYPLLTLCILGILLGVAQYKYGLAGAMFLHFVNNLFADAILFPLIL